MHTSFVRSIALFGAIAMAAALAGCGLGHKQTIYTGNGSVSVSDQGPNGQKTVTINGNGGSMSIGTGNVDLSKIGAPVYPGASQDQDSTISASSDKGTSVTAVFKTPDAFSKVESYYKSQLPPGSEKMNMSTNDGSLATFQIGDESTPEQTAVTVTAKQGDPTSIMIQHTSKSSSTAASAAPEASASP